MNKEASFAFAYLAQVSERLLGESTSLGVKIVTDKIMKGEPVNYADCKAPGILHLGILNYFGLWSMINTEKREIFALVALFDIGKKYLDQKFGSKKVSMSDYLSAFNIEYRSFATSRDIDDFIEKGKKKVLVISDTWDIKTIFEHNQKHKKKREFNHMIFDDGIAAQLANEKLVSSLFR